MPGQKKKIKVAWLSKKKDHLNQIYSSGLEYCFVSEDNKQACSFVRCKDYLQDALMATHQDKAVDIYGFSYNPKTDPPVCLSQTRLILVNSSDASFMDKIPALLDFINQIERKLHLIRTKATIIANPPKKYEKCGAVLLESSSRWILSPPLISLYTLLLRVGFSHIKGESYEETVNKVQNHKTKPYQSNDAQYLSSAKKGIEQIVKIGYARIFYKEPKRNFPDVNINTMHNSFGIVGFSHGHTKGHRLTKWHRKQQKVDPQQKVSAI